MFKLRVLQWSHRFSSTAVVAMRSRPECLRQQPLTTARFVARTLRDDSSIPNFCVADLSHKFRYSSSTAFDTTQGGTSRRRRSRRGRVGRQSNHEVEPAAAHHNNFSRTIRSMLQRPVGTWKTRDMLWAQGMFNCIMETKTRERKRLDPIVGVLHNAKEINQLFALLGRFVREVVTVSKSKDDSVDGKNDNGDDDQFGKWLGKSSRVLLKTLLTIWKDAHLDPNSTDNTKRLISAPDLLRLLQLISSLLLPTGRMLDIDTFVHNVLATVDIKLAGNTSSRQAEQVADQWLARIKQGDVADDVSLSGDATRMPRKQLEPSIVTYNLVLQAWTNNVRPESVARVQALVEEMQHNKNLTWNMVTFRILIQFWARQGNLDHDTAILDQLQANVSPSPNPLLLSCAIHILAKHGHTIRAEDCLQQLMAHCNNDRSNKERLDTPQSEQGDDVVDHDAHKYVAESAHHIMNTYRRDVANESLNQYRRSEAVERAEALVRRLEASGLVASASMIRIKGTMMDIYALSGNVAKAHSIFASTAPDAVSYGLLIKAYSRHGNMLEATKVVQQLLADPNVTPSVNIFTVLVEGWAVSKRPDAVDQAFAVLRLLREHHRCVELNIRPNNYFFTSLLKCLAASKASNAGERAEALLDEMDREAERSTEKDDYFHRPDCVTLSLAIKTCFEAGDLTRAESIMKRMETSDTPPNTRTYNSILQYYAQLGTSAAAQRTENIISYMKELSQTTKAAVEPNAISYNIVLAAWARSGDADATERMWTVYQRMQSESISPSMASYNTLVSFFAKSGGKETLARADQVLQDMVQRNHAEFRPDFRHFNPVINAFLHSNDASSATATLVRYIEGYLCDSHECSKPNRSYFSRVTKAWIQTGDLITATVFLDKIQELHDALHLPEGPCRESYRALVAAWDTSDHPRKSEYTARLETKLSSFARALE